MKTYLTNWSSVHDMKPDWYDKYKYYTMGRKKKNGHI